MIEVNLQKNFGAFSIDVNFSSSHNGITVLAGPSGSGKSSIISMIAGLIAPDKGRIQINGRLLFDSAKGVNCPSPQRRCGYVFQDGRLFPHMNVRSNLLYGSGGESRKLEDIARLLGIEDLLKRMPGKLSGGEKQRVAIGRALLMRPQILLMDEPLASLDSERKEELLPYIAQIPKRFHIPVFYVTHSRREILRLSDVLIRIDQGKVQSSGKPEGEYLGYGVSETAGEHLSVFECRITGFDPRFGVVSAAFPGGSMYILADKEPRQTSIRAAIRASDVSVSLSRPENISTRNIFTGKVMSLEESTGQSVLVHTDVGVPLTARISRASAERLALKPQKEVFLLVKAVSMTF